MKDKTKLKMSFYITFGYTLSLLGVVLLSIVLLCIFYFAGYRFDTMQRIVVLYSIITASIVVGLGIATFVCRRALKPIDEIGLSLEAITKGDYTQKIEEKNKLKFLRNLISQYNEMLDVINSSAVLKEDFVRNFSHEFKTPIVSILGYAEVLRDMPDLSNEDKLKYLNIIIQESKRLSSLSQQTLFLSKLESKSIPNNKESYRLDLQLEECVLLLDQSLKQKNIEVIFKLLPLTIYANRDLLSEVWINIIHNAIKHCEMSGQIDISIFEDETTYQVSIRDNGCGMSDDEKNHIFDKYFQGDTSHKSEGIGLGLSIVNSIIKLYQGRIEVNSILGKGSLFTVIFSKQVIEE